MLVLLLAYSLTRSKFGEAGPIPPIEGRALCSTGEQETHRTLWNITWSCLTTIFLCTWVAIHPNVAFRRKKHNMTFFDRWLWHPAKVFLSYKLPLFLCALLVPEYILAWAVRQYLRAGEIQKQVDGWTRTHGFFVIMGGFHLFRLPDGVSSTPLLLKSLSPSDFVTPSGRYSHKDEIPVHPLEMDDLPIDILDMISPTEDDLKDRGKSDELTKVIVLVQTLWFVIQCIARGIQQLPLTELEVVTLAYTMINFFIYTFWWDKPRNVDCPIRVYKASTAKEEKTVIQDLRQWEESLGEKLLQMVISYSMGFQDKFIDLSNETSVPMFWSGRPDDLLLAGASVGPSLLGAAFGAIHCVAWPSEFPSRAELILWRVSCIAMMAVPLMAAILCVSIRISLRGTENGWAANTAVVLGITLGLSAWLYVAARIATLIIALATLRSLPSAAFNVIDWTIFIPHI